MRRMIVFILVVLSMNSNAQEKGVFDVEDNPIPFFNLNPSDSYDAAKQKLGGQNYEVTVETRIVIIFTIYAMANKLDNGRQIVL